MDSSFEDWAPKWMQRLPGICLLVLVPAIFLAGIVMLSLGWLLLPKAQFNRWFS